MRTFERMSEVAINLIFSGVPHMPDRGAAGKTVHQASEFAGVALVKRFGDRANFFVGSQELRAIRTVC